ncbi:MAG: dTDP-4-dehydrorhamnose 3,5-epimerase [Kiritimatiellae bacterium]|nr:dTDP-4-dehydrorhamnose 3,5-epimerase [Kiritimatiellia bacterium]
MKIEATALPGVMICEPEVFKDSRGFFLETYHARKYFDIGVKTVFVQDNRSRSTRSVLRGLHFQLHHPQAKLLSCIRGEIYDVAVDIRRGSPTFGKWVGATLSEDNFKQIFIPAGFAHGFCVMSDIAEINYKCSEFYDHKDDRGIRWNDPELGVEWPVTDPILSEKDRRQPFLCEAELPLYNNTGGE